MHERKTFITKGEVQYQVFFICLSHIHTKEDLEYAVPTIFDGFQTMIWIMKSLWNQDMDKNFVSTNFSNIQKTLDLAPIEILESKRDYVKEDSL